MIHQSLAARAIGGGVIALATIGFWLAILPAPSAVLAAVSTAAASLLLIAAGVLGLMVESRPAVARIAPHVRWIALAVGVVGAALNAFLTPSAGLVVAAVVAVTSMVTVILCTNVISAPQRIEQQSFAVFPPLE